MFSCDFINRQNYKYMHEISNCAYKSTQNAATITDIKYTNSPSSYNMKRENVCHENGLLCSWVSLYYLIN